MTDRIAHDHPTVDTREATIERYGGTRRPEIQVEKRLTAEPDTVVRLVLEGSEYRAPLEQTADSRPVFRHAAKTPRLARNPSATENELVTWVRDHELEIGRTVFLDIIESGFKYGLRAPGDEAVYETGKPRDSLANIAQKFDTDSG